MNYHETRKAIEAIWKKVRDDIDYSLNDKEQELLYDVMRHEDEPYPSDDQLAYFLDGLDVGYKLGRTDVEQELNVVTGEDAKRFLKETGLE